jgi:mannose-6-phosphate isomerase-like protein (cupin superfamily)
MKGFKSNIKKDALNNTKFRKVLYTGEHLQIAILSLKPGEDIGIHSHKNVDQFFRFEGGKGKCVIDEMEYKVENGDAIVVLAGSEHNILNTDITEELKFCIIYVPPKHKNGVISATKKDAEINDIDYY